MAKIEGVCREVCEATEYVAIVTQGEGGPHLAGHWGSYMFLDVASKKVQGSKSPGQGCEIRGSGEVVASGKFVDAVRARFPWARGALVVRVEQTSTQL